MGSNITAFTVFGLDLFGLNLHFNGGGQGNGFVGSAWRGLMGQALHLGVCHLPSPLCTRCPKAAVCVYPNLFKPCDGKRLPPFWLHGWQRHRRGWTVGIRWIGTAQHYGIGQWLHALSQPSKLMMLGGQSLRLERVTSLSGSSLWDSTRGWRTLPEAIKLCSQAPSPDRCVIRFLTPLVSKHDGDLLFAPLRTRAQRLINQYGDGRPLAYTATPWTTQVMDCKKQHIPLARRTLTGVLPVLELSALEPGAWDLLLAGSEWHAGGQTALGCGHYQIEAMG